MGHLPLFLPVPRGMPRRWVQERNLMGDFEEPQISRRIAMVAHDNKKVELLGWAEFNVGQLRHHELFATGTTGTMLEYELGLKVHCFLSGPLGGDQQIGAKIAEGDIDVVIFSSPLMTGDYMPSRPIMDRPSTGAEYVASAIA